MIKVGRKMTHNAHNKGKIRHTTYELAMEQSPQYALLHKVTTIDLLLQYKLSNQMSERDITWYYDRAVSSFQMINQWILWLHKNRAEVILGIVNNMKRCITTKSGVPNQCFRTKKDEILDDIDQGSEVSPIVWLSYLIVVLNMTTALTTTPKFYLQNKIAVNKVPDIKNVDDQNLLTNQMTKIGSPIKIAKNIQKNRQKWGEHLYINRRSFEFTKRYWDIIVWIWRGYMAKKASYCKVGAVQRLKSIHNLSNRIIKPTETNYTNITNLWHVRISNNTNRQFKLGLNKALNISSVVLPVKIHNAKKKDNNMKFNRDLNFDLLQIRQDISTIFKNYHEDEFPIAIQDLIADRPYAICFKDRNMNKPNKDKSDNECFLILITSPVISVYENLSSLINPSLEKRYNWDQFYYNQILLNMQIGLLRKIPSKQRQSISKIGFKRNYNNKKINKNVKNKRRSKCPVSRLQSTITTMLRRYVWEEVQVDQGFNESNIVREAMIISTTYNPRRSRYKNHLPKIQRDRLVIPDHPEKSIETTFQYISVYCDRNLLTFKHSRINKSLMENTDTVRRIPYKILSCSNSSREDPYIHDKDGNKRSEFDINCLHKSNIHKTTRGLHNQQNNQKENHSTNITIIVYKLGSNLGSSLKGMKYYSAHKEKIHNTVLESIVITVNKGQSIVQRINIARQNSNTYKFGILIAKDSISNKRLRYTKTQIPIHVTNCELPSVSYDTFTEIHKITTYSIKLPVNQITQNLREITNSKRGSQMKIQIQRPSERIKNELQFKAPINYMIISKQIRDDYWTYEKNTLKKYRNKTKGYDHCITHSEPSSHHNLLLSASKRSTNKREQPNHNDCSKIIDSWYTQYFRYQKKTAINLSCIIRGVLVLQVINTIGEYCNKFLAFFLSYKNSFAFNTSFFDKNSLKSTNFELIKYMLTCKFNRKKENKSYGPMYVRTLVRIQPCTYLVT